MAQNYSPRRAAADSAQWVLGPRPTTPHGRSDFANSMSPEGIAPRRMSPRKAPPRRTSPPSNGARSSSVGSAKLQKTTPTSGHARASSGQFYLPPHPDQPSLQDLRRQQAARDQFGLPSPPLPAPPALGFARPRSSSVDRPLPPTPNSARSRPAVPDLHISAVPPLVPDNASAEKKKHGWFHRSKKDKDDEHGPVAWIAGHPQRPTYDPGNLLDARPVPELWDNVEGSCYIYLFPKSFGARASFMVDSAVFASSQVLTNLALGGSHPPLANGDSRQMPLDARMRHMSIPGPDSPPRSPSSRHGPFASSTSSRDPRDRTSHTSDSSPEIHLYLSLNLESHIAFNTNESPRPGTNMSDLQTLIDYRNFFAFLCGQALIATEKRGSLFSIFMTIASLLKSYEFTNLDASTFGEVASTSFNKYVEELGLDDVRTSREKTIEGIVLGERMKSVLLYNEAFTHAVGKLDELTELGSPKSDLISHATRTRLARASMDLEKRLGAVRLTLQDFDFPSIFTGIMHSKTAEERREGVRFDAWKDSFLGTRKWMISVLRQRYGDWPPKAKSKRNDLETSGLQRLVLRDLFHDMTSMYDLIVDRTRLTTRTADGADRAGPKVEPRVRALHSALSEYDRSSPPVKPPIPFDLPKIPSLKATRPEFGAGDAAKDAKAATKKLKDEEISHVLRSSWNEDAHVNPFVNAFRDMEKRAAHGCTLQEIIDLRIGQWIFMYAVIQALPMLACDAPGLRHTHGVEYFLVEAPRSGVPWADPEKGTSHHRTWFSVGDAGGVVSLPSDLVEHGVEGIYRRSHCWQMAERWAAPNPLLNSALQDREAARGAAAAVGLPLPPPPSALAAPRSRSQSPAGHQRHGSLGIGLEALPLPAGVTPDGRQSVDGPRSSHNVDASKTFDAILANVNLDKPKKKK